MKRLLAVLLLVASSAYAGEQFKSLGGELTYARDTEGNSMVREDVNVWANTSKEDKQVGVRLTASQYSNAVRSHNATSVSVITDYKINDYRLTGNLGIGSLSSKVYLYGDMNASKKVNENLDVFAGVVGDVVDSVQGLANGVTYTGAYAGVDWYNDRGGATATVRQMQYSNSNTQSGWTGKAYLNVVDGVNVYVSTRQYHNSNPYNGFYYSPEDYARYNLGVGFRKRIADFVVAGFVETGRINADSTWSNAAAARLAVETPKKANGPIYGFAVGTDLSNASGYRYDYARVYLRYDF